ncbi:putative oxidoreductase [Helianthus annuus]|uniref:Oxidoreductase n=1 Tax=Helianthus annuus TaxID=4232 RepID=A0A251TZ31_HELAN|nr:cytochrome P450 81Q32 [Helianthus annuus]KAF5792265.1 putative oxidoreductase [Helianthus annuus]KAJ0527224.1 putative oxidoreductase [Helianthus annuus]KAJ0543627.1 putative oxidoreductase [Helianthus annuus]KAJ0708682.1 putative oxidoreductase [Helianthus annuus]KAJ0712599.1 putative oxidoreductase [Helianthus annuus]
MDHLIHFLIALILLVLFFVADYFRRKYYNLPPTIFPCLPVIGHLYLLKQPLYRSLFEIAAKHGPILYLRFGTHRILLISSPSLTEECLIKNDIIFANRPRWLYGKILASNYTNLSWAQYGTHWRNLRRISTIEIFSTTRMNEFQEVRVEEGTHLVRKLVSESSSPVYLRPIFHHITFNILIRLISGERYFGRELEEKREQFHEIVKEMFKVGDLLNMEDHLPILRWLGMNGLERKMTKLQEKRNAYFQALIDELRKVKDEEDENKKKNTMIAVLFRLQKSDPDYYNDKLIKIFLLNLLAAGTDGPVSTMEWAFSLLLNHPDVLEKAQNEIDKVVGKERLVNESDIANLPYLRCVVSETLRLYPPTPLLLPHQSTEDCVVGGYHVPRGTVLLVNQWGIQHDPKVWSDPERFDPERFVGFEASKDRFRLMAFGAGRRACPGELLAMRMIWLTMGLLIQCFDWERTTEELIDLNEGLGLTMPKAQPLVAKCTPRSMTQSLVS